MGVLISPTGVLQAFNSPGPRQMSVEPRPRGVSRSVVIVGIVQVRLTRSPLRVARKSVGGFGSSNEGGCGGPIVAHAARINVVLTAKTSLCAMRLMRRKRVPRYGPRPLSSKFFQRLAENVCVPVHMIRFRLRRHQRHVVERRK